MIRSSHEKKCCRLRQKCDSSRVIMRIETKKKKLAAAEKHILPDSCQAQSSKYQERSITIQGAEYGKK